MTGGECNADIDGNKCEKYKEGVE